MTSSREERFAARLLEWYDVHGRHDLPWRADDASPFEVLVAELMLQRTSVEQVADVYSEFVRRYPTPEAVAEASEAELAEPFERLGLAKRARFLEEIAERLVDAHGGDVPRDRSELLDFPGVGEYTARSVLAHAHGDDVAAADRNVDRILSRAFASEVGGAPSTDELVELAERLAPDGRGSDFTLALLDLAAAVCTANDPSCGDCPVRRECRYYDRL